MFDTLRSVMPNILNSPVIGLVGLGTAIVLALPSPAGTLSETILFAKPSSTNRYAIFRMRPDGNEMRPVADIPASCREPNLCAANNCVAFSALSGKNWHIFTVNLNTNELKQITEGHSDSRHPVWYPDGSKIFYETDTWGQSELAVIDLNTQNAQRLTFNQCINRYPALSPDGNKLAYTSWINGFANIFELTLDPQQLNDSSSWNRTWAVNTIVTKRKCLTKGHRPCTRPSWSGNGQHIAFECLDYKNTFIDTNSENTQMRHDMQKKCLRAKDPAWSPNSRHILYRFDHKKEHVLKLYDVEAGTVSDFPRQFSEAACDLIWQRCPLPWSMDGAI